MYGYYINTTIFPDQSLLNFNPPAQKESSIQKIQEELQLWQKKYGSLKKKFLQLEKENDALQIEIQELQAKLPCARKKKVKRRSDRQLVKEFLCHFDDYRKRYASQLALQLHMKHKHNAGSRKERNQLICYAIECLQKGNPMPQIYLNLPPQSLKELQEAIQSNMSKAENIDSIKQETGHHKKPNQHDSEQE